MKILIDRVVAVTATSSSEITGLKSTDSALMFARAYSKLLPDSLIEAITEVPPHFKLEFDEVEDKFVRSRNQD